MKKTPIIVDFKNLKNLLGVLVLNLTFGMANGQLIYSDEEGVRLNLEIKNTGKVVRCENEWDKNYTDEPLQVWRVTLSFFNGSNKTLVPKLVGIASIDINPSNGKFLDYCGYKPLFEQGVMEGAAHLFGFIIWPNKGGSIEAGEKVAYSANLYLLPGSKPLLARWNFPGYEFVDGSKNPNLKAIGFSEDTKNVRFESQVQKPTQPKKSVSIQEKRVKPITIDDVAPIKHETTQTSEVRPKPVVNKPNIDNLSTSASTISNGKCPDKNAIYFREQAEKFPKLKYELLAEYYERLCPCLRGSSAPNAVKTELNAIIDRINQSGTQNKIYPRAQRCISSNENVSDNYVFWEGNRENFTTVMYQGNIDSYFPRLLILQNLDANDNYVKAGKKFQMIRISGFKELQKNETLGLNLANELVHVGILDIENDLYYYTAKSATLKGLGNNQYELIANFHFTGSAGNSFQNNPNYPAYNLKALFSYKPIFEHE